MGAATSGAWGAEDPWALCDVQRIPTAEGPIPISELPAFVAPAAPGEGAARISADRAVSHTPTRTTFEGDVRVLQEDRRLEAERAEYYRQSDTMEIEGGIRYYTPSIFLQGERATVQMDSDSGMVTDGTFRVPEAHAYGRAARIRFLDAEHTRLEQASYTTCNPDRIDWELRASRIELDETTNTGEAYHATLWFKGVPFLYLPYLNYPLSGRKSGFLTPTYADSELNGTDVEVPYYWNIAPNRDATLTPRYMSRRGTLLQGEFRYLDRSAAGQVEIDHMADDQIFGDERYRIIMNHTLRPAPGWNASLTYNQVSDDAFLNDFERNLGTASITHLPRIATVSYAGTGWSARLRAEDYQPLTGLPPYARLPQLEFRGATGDVIRYDLRGEAVRFTHEDPTRVQGTRVDIQPGIGLPLQGAAWFITPRISYRLTEYRLDNPPEGLESSVGRGLPVASLDGGLFFERDLVLGGKPLVQTLEPRLFYLHVPFEDQSNLPRFDTSALTFSYASLFREERFSGADRVGDANQLTAAVTTRFINSDTGLEYGRASAGQIIYFDDREVTLSGTTEEQARSSYVGELAFNPNRRLEIKAAAQWDPFEDKTEVTSIGLRYADGTRKIFNTAYRYRLPDQEQIDAALFWPLNPRWHLIGRWWYDLEEDRPFERVAGVGYETCCWSVQGVVRRRPVETEGELIDERSYIVTFNLKGLATIGRRLEDALERGVLGYGLGR